MGTKDMLDKLSTPAGGVTVSTGLILSPKWAGALSELNIMLGTASLTIGIMVGLATLHRLWRKWR